MDVMEYPEVSKEEKGAMHVGRLKLTSQAVIFKNSKTGKVDQVQSSDIESVKWQRMAANFGLRIMAKNGQLYRFGGIVENDHDKIAKFISSNFGIDMEDKEMCLKGWNWGTARFQGNSLSFDVDKNSAFEIPLGNVSHCTNAKNEVTMEFHQNDEAAISLMELRFHIPTDASSDVDPLQAFVDNVLSKASIIQATGDAIVTFKELQCLTPRGRYDIKIFPTFIQLHGKTFDYKIPLSSVLRLFLLPHKDSRQMFFVLSLDPPITQGQTRYHFLILLFSKEEEITVELRLSDADIKEKYEDKLQKEMSGPTFEVLSRIMKALVQRKITVPGNFKGHSGAHAITCSYRAGNGLLYPLERGLIFIHKPPVHIRFDEIGYVNFARSGGSTRSFDFEVETKSGVVHTFSSIEKEEYGRLYDFVSTKHLRIKNRNTGLSGKEKPVYHEDDIVDSDVEDEPDAYLQRVKDEAREREEAGGSSDESSDESFNPGESGSEVAEEYDSNPPTSPDSDDDYEGGSGSGSSMDEDERPPKEKKERKPREKKSRSAKTVKEPGMRKKRKKKERDENKPKRPASAYFLFLAEMREKIKRDHPGIAITELSKKAGEMWKEVSDKSKWEEQAAGLKKEYEKQMAEYKAAGGDSKSKSDKKDSKEKASKKSPIKSPTKSPGSFKSKEYVTSSESSSDSDEKPLKSKKSKEDKSKAKEEKMEVDDASSPAASSEGSDEE